MNTLKRIASSPVTPEVAVPERLRNAPGAKLRDETTGTRLTASIRRKITQAGSAGEFTTLCDVGELEHVLGLVRDGFASRRAGEPPCLESGIRTLLIEPLERYLASLVVPKPRVGTGAGRRMEHEQTEDLLGAARLVVNMLRAGPWTEQQDIEAVGNLKDAWLKWIAYVASYWLWSRVPELLTQAEVRREHGRMGGKVARQSDTATEKQRAILAVAESLSKTMENKSVAAAVASRLGVSEQYVRKVIRDAAAKKAKQ